MTGQQRQTKDLILRTFISRELVLPGKKTRQAIRSTPVEKHRPRLEPVPAGFAGDDHTSCGCFFTADGLKRYSVASGASFARSAGAETRRVFAAATTTMSEHTTTITTAASASNNDVLATSRVRPGHVQPPWTYRSDREAMRRQSTEGGTATSNTSRVEAFLSDNRGRVSFFFLSSFRDPCVYPGRVGRGKIAHRKHRLQPLSRQTSTSRGVQYSVGQGGRNRRCAR